ncbi:amino acid ABC transporter membrane protein 1, PAAT family [Pseudomonas chlororaphis]|uniref:amino acid ABC transporter permease n=1 Tax=Pseudomonas TaxID=286 RepID=UPI000879E40C|nr:MULTISPECIES: amino acid ABC transporter permease [Pseudomonas]AZD67501.1 Glutamate Aspartate transport system permease protein GltJ [Pseudomonas chlororaphis subsp. aurantiaca]PWY40398.1 amino acid ABC transporter permease [Pseudomonas sp. RW409]QIT23473.1 amino acid ABC transporter permease [Pseudomonas chlororaphis subsp. aurantiaca]WDH01563.1 amino acid ABC transporter permease [Pseudomonas chlororaphis]WDH09589.1 amino acid ABC transporter permease [Pseudomonas chlororaphis]
MKHDFDLAAVLQGEYAELIVKGIETTLQLALFAWLLAMALALLLVTVRLTGNKLADRLVAGYVSYHRNVPTLVQLMLWYFGVPTLLSESTQLWLANYSTEYLFSVIALGLCQAAYFCEDIRSGLRAIPAGQAEASRALGLGYVRSMRYVILPQGVRNCLPSLINHTVLLFKNTSLAMAIGVVELTYATREVENYTFRTFESYLVATVFYLVFSLLLMGLGALLARRFNKALAR